MNQRQQKTVDRFGQVLTFLDANTKDIPATAVAGQRQVLEGAVTQINGFAQDQVMRGNEVVLAQTLSSARIALRDTYMRAVATVGLQHLTGKNAGDPNVSKAAQIFALPATRTNPSTLIASANAMLATATPYSSIYTRFGVSLDSLAGGIQALQNAMNAELGAQRIKKGATQGIIAQIRAGQGAVRMMDVVIRPLLAGDKQLLAQWDTVKRAAGALNLATPVPLPIDSPAVPGTATSGTPGTAGTPATAGTTGTAATPGTAAATSSNPQPASGGAPTSAAA